MDCQISFSRRSEIFTRKWRVRESLLEFIDGQTFLTLVQVSSHIKKSLLYTKSKQVLHMRDEWHHNVLEVAKKKIEIEEKASLTQEKL